jgi:hypothetical protein
VPTLSGPKVLVNKKSGKLYLVVNTVYDDTDEFGITFLFSLVSYNLSSFYQPNQCKFNLHFPTNFHRTICMDFAGRDQ